MKFSLRGGQSEDSGHVIGISHGFEVEDSVKKMSKELNKASGDVSQHTHQDPKGENRSCTIAGGSQPAQACLLLAVRVTPS